MAWTTQVSATTWRSFQRGGKWIPPHLWAACQAKAQAQRYRSAGAAWREYGAPSTRKWSNGGQPRRPAPQPAPKPTPKVRVKPETPEGKAEVTELRAWITQVRELLASNGVTLPAPPSPTSASPEEEADADFRWTRRQNEAHGKLRKWEQTLRDAREKQRMANRAVESAQQHITHFKKKLLAAKERDENWDEIQFEEIDWDRDSQLDDKDNDEEMSTTEEGSTDFWAKNSQTTAAAMMTVFQPQSPLMPPDCEELATVQPLNEKGLSEQDIQLRAAQIHEQQVQLRAAQQIPLGLGAENMVAPGIAPDEY